MKNESAGGIGLYPLIFMIIFIRRYFAGMDITNAHEWIGIAIASFFWLVGIVVVILVIAGILTIINAIKD